MIRRGREQGWLRKSISELRPWANLFGASFDGIKFAEAGEGKGTGVVATRNLKGGEHQGPLMVIPRDLVISTEQVQQQAKSDGGLRELLEACGDFVRTPRGAILVFLLYQCTVAIQKAGYEHLVEHKIGTRGPYMDYVKFLPEELLPTFWHTDELLLLSGTSLQPAVTAKMKSLQREFDELRELTKEVSWCRHYWWEELQWVSFDDWLQVDAMYRSRALEFPGIGDAMVPCIDMANHAADSATKALYETDSDGNAILILLDDVEVAEGEEITITYGDNKGACEMLFSYGFIDAPTTSAKELFLSINPPGDDPLGEAKAHVATVPPGVKFFLNKEGRIDWVGDYMYLLSVNEEDGLEFVVAQTTDGEQELQMLWKNAVIRDTAAWREELERTGGMYYIFQLRATSLLADRIRMQLDRLEKNTFENEEYGDGGAVRERIWMAAKSLWELEVSFLQAALAKMEEDIQRSMKNNEEVKSYLRKMQEEAEKEEQMMMEKEKAEQKEQEEEDEDFS